MDRCFKWYIAGRLGRTVGLSFAAKGLYADFITLWRDKQTVRDDPREVGALTNARDYRSIRKPLAELKARRKVYTDEHGILRDQGRATER
jgi:hypothetical protein